MPRVTQDPAGRRLVFGYGPLTLYGATFHPLRLTSRLPVMAVLQPLVRALRPGQGLGSSAFARHYSRNRISLSFPPPTEMFHFGGYRSEGL